MLSFENDKKQLIDFVIKIIKFEKKVYFDQFYKPAIEAFFISKTCDQITFKNKIYKMFLKVIEKINESNDFTHFQNNTYEDIKEYISNLQNIIRNYHISIEDEIEKFSFVQNEFSKNNINEYILNLISNYKKFFLYFQTFVHELLRNKRDFMIEKRNEIKKNVNDSLLSIEIISKLIDFSNNTSLKKQYENPETRKRIVNRVDSEYFSWDFSSFYLKNMKTLAFTETIKNLYFN